MYSHTAVPGGLCNNLAYSTYCDLWLLPSKKLDRHKKKYPKKPKINLTALNRSVWGGGRGGWEQERRQKDE